jgi:hypothetical protein
MSSASASSQRSSNSGWAVRRCSRSPRGRRIRAPSAPQCTYTCQESSRSACSLEMSTTRQCAPDSTQRSRSSIVSVWVPIVAPVGSAACFWSVHLASREAPVLTPGHAQPRSSQAPPGRRWGGASVDALAQSVRHRTVIGNERPEDTNPGDKGHALLRMCRARHRKDGRGATQLSGPTPSRTPARDGRTPVWQHPRWLPPQHLGIRMHCGT